MSVLTGIDGKLIVTIKHRYTIKCLSPSANAPLTYYPEPEEDYFCIDASNNNVTLVLPDPKKVVGMLYKIRVGNIGVGKSVVIDPEGNATIDGAQTKTLLANTSYDIIALPTEYKTFR